MGSEEHFSPDVPVSRELNLNRGHPRSDSANCESEEAAVYEQEQASSGY